MLDCTVSSITILCLIARKDGLVEYAEKIKSKAKQHEKIEASQDIIDVIKELPDDRSYYTMADVTKALGEIR